MYLTKITSVIITSNINTEQKNIIEKRFICVYHIMYEKYENMYLKYIYSLFIPFTAYFVKKKKEQPHRLNKIL